ncbi:class I poly(R)-hydroxyalkanoic acid synthase [Brevundimonas balnearis]|uniref:Class I poly(R)-hydroxyalkanoic acid synthase n=1 Tax=Brevundimonas balnearis TaxID=1572858 RepID=A0ABV6QZE6_9CAUL
MAKAPKTRATTPRTAAKATARDGTKPPPRPRSKPKPRPAPESAPPIEASAPQRQAASPQPQAEGWANPADMLSPEQRQMLETLSLNLARAAMTAQAAIAEAALSQADRPAAMSPDPFNVAPAMTAVMSSLAARPDRVFRAQADLFNRYMDLWASTTRRAAGEEQPKPSSDKRFKDAAWSDNPVFDAMRQSYLITAEWMNGLVAQADDVDPLTRRRAEFFMKLLTDAFSPSNFLASNPVALKALMESSGESLVKGMENFAADIERGGGKLKISQADYARFKVGENVATAPGQVVWRDELFELIQYDAATDQQHAVPLLIFPPWINKFYILDLQPENSMIRWLSAQGFTVFVCSWVNPDIDKAEFGFDDYLHKGIYRAVEKTLEQSGSDRVNTVGYCIGGTLLGAALAHMAARDDARIGAATFFAAQHDFAEAGDLLLFTDEHWLAEIEKQMDAAGGVLPGAAMADTFNALRANDLIWSFFVSNYLMGKAPPAFDLLFWNADQTRMPKRLHMDYLRSMYGRNALTQGLFELGGERIDLSRVTIPLYFQASREDHIAPMRSVYRSARAFRNAQVTLTLAGSGHIAGVINPPSARKYQHWINPSLPETLEDWRAGAEEHPGSWWDHWAGWLRERSGPKVAARDPKKGPLPAIEPAPGSYVKVKS